MKKIFLFLAIFTSLAFSTIDEFKTDVYFGNGILTKQQTAKILGSGDRNRIDESG